MILNLVLGVFGACIIWFGFGLVGATIWTFNKESWALKKTERIIIACSVVCLGPILIAVAGIKNTIEWINDD